MHTKPYSAASEISSIAVSFLCSFVVALICTGQITAQDTVSRADLAMLSKAMQGEVVLNRDQREARIEKASAEAMSQAAQILNLSLVFFSTRNETPVTFNSQTTKSQSLLLPIATNPKLPIKSRQLAFNTIAISLDESENAKLFEKEIWKLASGFTESQLETFVLSLSLSRWDSTRSVRLSAVLRLIKLPQFTERVQIALISAMGSAVSSNLCRQIDALAVFSAMHKQDKLTIDANKTMFTQFELWVDAQDVFDSVQTNQTEHASSLGFPVDAPEQRSVDRSQKNRE